MQVTWTKLKEVAQTKKVGFTQFEDDQSHRIMLNEINSYFFTIINKTDPRNADQIDFEDNYLSIINAPTIIKSESLPFNSANGFRFRGASFKGICDYDVITDIDYQIAEERWIDGGSAIIDNIGDEDQITFQVVDKDNVLGLGAGVVLDEFIKDYYVPKDGKLEVSLAYPARIVEGLYLRLKYKSTHEHGCVLKCNLRLHWKAS